MSDLSNPIFHDETKAREWLEARVWAKGRNLPALRRCRSVHAHAGQDTRAGLYQCNACREPFTVTVGTLYERSKIPLHTWLAVTHLMMASKKGMSALQISRMIGKPYKTVWFLCHRIRECLKASPNLAPMGGQNKVVEADETYVGGKAKNRAHREPAPKKAVFSLVERDGNVRSFHMPTRYRQDAAPDHRRMSNTQRLDDGRKPDLSEDRGWLRLHGTVNHSANEYALALFWHSTRPRTISAS